MGFLEGASIVDRVGLVASMIAIGSMTGGTVALGIRLLHRHADLDRYTIYGGLSAGWFTTLVVLVSWAIG
jgi:hypothetical protein